MRLSLKELNKRDNWNVFCEKVKNNSSFETIDGFDIVLDNSIISDKLDENPDCLKYFRMGKSIMLPVNNGTFIPLSNLFKTGEFGSRTMLTKEQKTIEKLSNQIKSLLKSGKYDCLCLCIDGKKYQIKSVESTPGTPKSDFHFVSPDGECNFFISYKDGIEPKHFQQWSGMSKREKDIYYHEETQQFIFDVVDLFEGKKSLRKNTCARTIKDDELKLKSVYGHDYGYDYGINNVHYAIQGNINITQLKGNQVTITSTIMFQNGTIPTDGYTPTFVAAHKGDRNQFGIPGARFSIYPNAGRKIFHNI